MKAMTEKELPPEIVEMYKALPPETRRRLVSDLRANIRRAQFVKIEGGK
jgi:hypothetical protein